MIVPTNVILRPTGVVVLSPDLPFFASLGPLFRPIASPRRQVTMFMLASSHALYAQLRSTCHNQRRSVR
jgi:hypothetical protein